MDAIRAQSQRRPSHLALALVVVFSLALPAHAQIARADCGDDGNWKNETDNKTHSCVNIPTCFCSQPAATIATKLAQYEESVINLTSTQQTHFKVGVLAIRGVPASFIEFNKTFNEYLNCEVSCRFSPKLSFEMVGLDFSTLYSSIPTKKVDFIYVNPSAYSCIESEWGASSLVSQIGYQTIGKKRYEIQEFGGVIFTKEDRADINSLADVKDKSIAAASISGLGSGQAQFLMFVKKGMSFINDPAQVVFTSNQGKVVKAVESGQVDIGFVRTNQLEKMDAAGKTVMSKFKILEKYVAQSGGEDYPFPITTDLYPEWNLAALTHVNYQVMQVVQQTMLKLRFPHPAAFAGNFRGWRPTLSYMMLRNMQEDVGFIEKNSAGKMQCIRGDTLWDSITCPAGHFKLAKDVVDGACAAVGRECVNLDLKKKDDDKPFKCVCKPCKRAFEVEVVPIDEGAATSVSARQQRQNNSILDNTGCAKMSVCGNSEQAKPIRFKVTDNKARDNFELTYGVRDFQNSDDQITLMKGIPFANEAYTYTIEVNVKSEGLALLEIYANNEQISESPLFVQVQKPVCADSLRVADEVGVCKCASSTAKIGRGCVRLSVLIPAIVIPLLLLLALAVYMYIRYMFAKRDAVWTVCRDELDFGTQDGVPVEILGRGTFGMVVKAEYRGTSVAVKRVIPAASGQKNRESIFDKESSRAFASTNQSMFSRTNSGEISDEEAGAGDGNEQSSNEQLAARAANARAAMLQPKELTSTGGTYSVSSRSQKKQSWWETVVYGDENSRLRDDFIEEMRTLSKLRHPCITTVMGAVVDKNTEPMMVMELMDYGSLYDLLHNDSMEIEGEVILPILRDIAQGLRFLHAAQPLIIHGDLKSHNVLVDSKFRAKVADFGLSQKKYLGISTHLGMAQAAPSGTPFWMAPELLMGNANSTSSDVFAFGIVLFEVYSRQEPYAGEDPADVLMQVRDLSLPVDKRPVIPASAPLAVAQLMKDCWNKQQELRPPFDEIERRLKALTAASCEPLQNKAANALMLNKTEDMLYDVFPRHIADALRQGKKVDPERKDCVTIFFSDIVGFTDISSTLDPEKISIMLHRLYSAFDDLSHAHGVFKVETIGDAYMAVTNLVEDQNNDHALRIAKFSIGAIKAAMNCPIDLDDASKGCVRIRVGFHSGPVVANVVGSRNLRYCLFGDTVNTASRMESNSEELKIHVSERSAEILRKQLAITKVEERGNIRVKKRGVIQVKGKGDMTTYWVSEPSSSKHGSKTNLVSSAPSQSPARLPHGLEAIAEPEIGTHEGSMRDVMGTSTAAATSLAPIAEPASMQDEMGEA